jgi:hypothetical protein
MISVFYLFIFVCKGHLQIISPEGFADLFPNATITVSYANFGLIPYGHTTVSLSFFLNFERLEEYFLIKLRIKCVNL